MQMKIITENLTIKSKFTALFLNHFSWIFFIILVLKIKNRIYACTKLVRQANAFVLNELN